MVRPFAKQGTLNNATVVNLMPAVAGRTYYVQRVSVVIKTHANAKLVKVQDDNGSPVVAFQHSDLTKAAGVPDVVCVDYGKRGYKLTADKAVDIVSEASGVAGEVLVEGYYVS